MKGKKISLILTIMVFGFTSLTFASDVITAKEYMAMVKDKNLVTIDANTASNYSTSHVKNAVNVPHKQCYQDGAVEGIIKSSNELAKYFGSKGISDKNTIVIYDDGSMKYASRVYWVLKYLGAPNVKVMHKDMDAWRAARVPLTRTATPVKAATFTANVDKSIIVDMAYVKQNLANDNVVIIDARDKAEYNGTSDDGKSKGHLPGAINIDYKECLTDKGDFKSKADLEAVASKHGLNSGKELILYCQTSVRAAVIFIAFKNILGYPKVSVFDGAYNEWVSNASNKLDK